MQKSARAKGKNQEAEGKTKGNVLHRLWPSSDEGCRPILHVTFPCALSQFIDFLKTAVSYRCRYSQVPVGERQENGPRACPAVSDDVFFFYVYFSSILLHFIFNKQ